MQTRDDVDVESVDLDAIAAIADAFPVRAAVLYGSRARGEATERSDVDVAVTFEDGLSSEARTDARLGLIERLATELETDAVDVVPLDRAPAALVDDVLADGILAYGSAEDVEALAPEASPRRSGGTLDAFDDVLADIERVV